MDSPASGMDRAGEIARAFERQESPPILPSALSVTDGHVANLNPNGVSSVKCALVLFGTGIGTGVLVIPEMTAQVGWAVMLVLLFVGAFATAFTTAVLFVATARVQASQAASHGTVSSIDTSGMPRLTYADVLLKSLPGNPWVKVVLDQILFWYAWGSIVVYLLFMRDFLCQLPFWTFGPDATCWLASCVCAVFMIPASVGFLAPVASATLIALAALVLAIMVECPQRSAARTLPLKAVGDTSQVGTVLCVAMFAYMWHTNCVNIARSMQKPTKSRSILVSVVSTFFVFILYVLLALAGYFSFGDVLIGTGSIVTMYDKDSVVFIGIRLILALALLIAIPLNLHPARESLVNMLKQFGIKTYKTSRAILGVCMMFGCAITAILYPEVLSVIRLMGGLLATFLLVVFPACIARLIMGRVKFIIVVSVSIPFSIYLMAAALELV